jgi:hypothetical protein
VLVALSAAAAAAAAAAAEPAGCVQLLVAVNCWSRNGWPAGRAVFVSCKHCPASVLPAIVHAAAAAAAAVHLCHCCCHCCCCCCCCCCCRWLVATPSP